MTPDDVSPTPIFDELLRELAHRTEPATPGPPPSDHPVPSPTPNGTPAPAHTPAPAPSANTAPPDPSRSTRGRRHRAE